MIVSKDIKELRQYLVDKLKKLFIGIDVFGGYPPEQYFGKLNRPLLSILINGADLETAGFQNYLGSGMQDDRWEELSGSYVNIAVRMVLHIPRRWHGQDSNEIFMELCTQLLFDNIYTFYGVSCCEMDFDQSTQTFRTEITAKTQLILTCREQAVPISEIRMRAEHT